MTEYKQRPVDFVLLALGVLMIIGSISPWVSILIVSVAGVDTWWGFVTIASGVLISVAGAARIWPSLIQKHLRRGLHIAALAASITALVTVSYVGFRLNEVSRDFNDAAAQSEPMANTTSEDELFGDFTADFQKSLEEFSNSIAEAFKPRLGTGWFICLIAGLGSVGLLLRRDTRRAPPVNN